MDVFLPACLVLFALLIAVVQVLVVTAKLRAAKAAACNEASRADAYSRMWELECDRLQKIAEYVGADDFVDSIGPILTKIDEINAGSFKLNHK